MSHFWVRYSPWLPVQGLPDLLAPMATVHPAVVFVFTKIDITNYLTRMDDSPLQINLAEENEVVIMSLILDAVSILQMYLY